MNPPDDRAILMRIARGDQEALHQLYTSYRPRLRRYLWHQLDGNDALVEEALQEVFLSIWRGAGGFRGEAQVATWLFEIAHHRAQHIRRDLARRARRVAVSLIEEAEGEEPRESLWASASHEEDVVNRLALADALAELSAQHREVLELVFVQGFALAEVAQILAVPVGTVKSRVSYARRALLKALTDARRMEERACEP